MSVESLDSFMDTEPEAQLDSDLANLQKVDVFTYQLPYFTKIKVNAFQTFNDIKYNLSRVILLNEIRPGFFHWTNRLIIFIHEYGLFFTKEDHIRLIKLYIQVMLTPDIDLAVVDLSFQVLTDLLKKISKLTREDLVIEWRPIYKLYLKIHNINDNSPILAPENLEGSSFGLFIPYARIYFDVSSTREILEELRPLMCPFDASMSQAFERCRLFLPTIMYEHETQHGYKLWLSEFLNIWQTFTVRLYWESHIINLFSRVAGVTADRFDWNPYIPYIFSNVLRGFGLPFGGKDSVIIGVAASTTTAQVKNTLSQNFTYSTDEISTIAGWLVAMIGCNSSSDKTQRSTCMNHIKFLFQALRSFYYPSNSGAWSANLFAFLQNMPDRFIRRLKKERHDNNKWYYKTNPSSHLTDDDIAEFVGALKDAAFTAIFSKSNGSQAKKAFQYLTFLRGDIMLPPLVTKMHESFQSLVEPHRYTSILGCLVKVARELVTYNPLHSEQTQLHLIPLINAVLPGLDPNDSNKTVLTLQFLSHTLGSVIICDCRPALRIRKDLSDYEKDLIFETSKFEDFIHEFFNKLFNYVDNLTSDLLNDGTAASATQFYKHSKNSEDLPNSYLIQTIRTIIRQSSKEILKIILNKVDKYIRGNTFNVRAGRIVSSICGNLSTSGIKEQALSTFLDYIHENLSKIKNSNNYEAILQNERGDIEISWNMQLLSELTKINGDLLAKNLPRINEMIGWFRNTVHKDTNNLIGFCFRNILMYLTNVSPVEMCSVNYSLIFDNEEEFFSNHLPIRDWAATGNIYALKVKYFTPSIEELVPALEFINTQLNISMKFLDESIHRSASLASSTKEERSRELNYINFLVYGGSRLLVRVSGQAYVTKHIDSCVQIGIPDHLDKGLGFEASNFDDPEHPYSKFSPAHRNIVLNKRQEVIEFVLRLAERLIEQQSNETTLFVNISWILLVGTITYGLFVNDFEKMWKTHTQAKSSMQNKLKGKKTSMRDELITRVMLQYKFRTFHIHTVLNELDIKVFNMLLKLSLNSSYAVVRKDAQSQLFSIVSHFPYSSLVVIPHLVEMLAKSDAKLPESERLSHDQLKGVLYLLKGNSMQESFMIKQNWQVISSLWPTLFNCQHFEKPSIQELLDSIFVKTNKDFDSFENRIQFSDKCVEAVCSLDSRASALARDPGRLDGFNKRCDEETRMTRGLMADLIRIAKESQLLWKNQTTSFGSVLFLLNSCEVDKDLLSEECIQLYVDSLVHENISIRKISIDALCIIFKMIKYKKQCRPLPISSLIPSEISNIAMNQPHPGYRADNNFHRYDPDFLTDCLNPNTDDDKKWAATNFLDKSYWGYYCWPKEISCNQNTRPTFTTPSPTVNNQYQSRVNPIAKRFSDDPEFVANFIKYSVIEECKGNEKFDKKKFFLFKGLFRNFGTASIFNGLYKHLRALVSDKDRVTHECKHKLAAEIVAGLIRGSKYWQLSQLKEMWTELKQVFDLIIENITNENINLWVSCFSVAFEDQDPRRMTFYLQYFTSLTTKIFGKETTSNESESDASTSSFQQTSCLQLLTSLNQLEWRIPRFWSNLFDLFTSNLSHPYKAIREKNSICITLSLVNHIDYSLMSGESESNDNFRRFIDYLEVKLSRAIELFDEVTEETIDGAGEPSKGNYDSEEHLNSMNIVQSLFAWIGYYMYKSYQPINDQLLRLFPKICSIDKIVAQDTILKAQLPIIRLFISCWILDDRLSSLLIDQLELVIKYKSWHSRMGAIQMCQSFGIFNLFQVSTTIRSRIQKMIIDALCDDQLEVRLSASIALTGFIHSNFIQANDELLSTFKTLSAVKARRKDKETGKFVINMTNLVKRHGGVLGISAIVASCPYDVPDYLPEAATYLCQFVNDPVPIQGTVKKCLSEFRRTHQDNWQQHSQKFNESQLSALSDILISPNYYA